ncbi:MAG: serine/threonine protein kinase, partial [Holophagales bacterium]|nr:serine/threonine protein kinase [Holophagales bacterium]
MPDLVGRKVGQVRLLSLLDRGGMGEVYRGFDEALERVVAVKTLRGDQRLEADARSRFRREARLLSKLEHPNICRIYELREGDEETGDFLILELVEGSKLDERTTAGLRFEQKLRIAEQIGSALASAHALRIVHRDLKPNNVMLKRGGQVKVLDFGLARSLDRTAEGFRDTPTPMRIPSFDPDLPKAGEPSTGSELVPGPWDSSHLETGSELMVGTLAFMSPEQAFGEELTEASDLYSFGLLLQWLFTGASAYGVGHTRLDLLRLVLQADTVPVQGLDADLTLLIEELKRHNPDHRPSAEECVRRLRHLLGKPARRRRRRSGAAAVALVAVALSLFIAFDRRQARLRTAAAVELTHEAKDIEWLVRLARSIPLHDLRSHKTEVRRRMGVIAGRLQTGGRYVEGPAHYALGRGHLALGELAAARRRLDSARAAGYRRPEVAFALGATLLGLYREVAAGQTLCDDPEWCEERDRWADRSLLEPAAALFGRSQVPGIGLAAFTEGSKALCEGRWEAALRAARQAATIAWFYEAFLLEGHVEVARGDAEGKGANHERAAASYLRAIDAYTKALAVGASDPDGYLALCRAHHRLAALADSSDGFHEGRSEGIRGYVVDAESACERARKADPERAEPILELARGELILARDLLDWMTTASWQAHMDEGAPISE